MLFDAAATPWIFFYDAMLIDYAIFAELIISPPLIR